MSQRANFFILFAPALVWWGNQFVLDLSSPLFLSDLLTSGHSAHGLAQPSNCGRFSTRWMLEICLEKNTCCRESNQSQPGCWPHRNTLVTQKARDETEMGFWCFAMLRPRPNPLRMAHFLPIALWRCGTTPSRRAGTALDRWTRDIPTSTQKLRSEDRAVAACYGAIGRYAASSWHYVTRSYVDHSRSTGAI